MAVLTVLALSIKFGLLIGVGMGYMPRIWTKILELGQVSTCMASGSALSRLSSMPLFVITLQVQYTTIPQVFKSIIFNFGQGVV